MKKKEPQLEQNIQIALKNNGIDLEDAIDIRQIKNLKLANQLLKQKRKKKIKRDQAQQKQMIDAQAQANAKASEAAAMAEVQKNQAMTESKVQVEQAKSQFEIQRMQTELTVKQQLMAQEFEYQKQLAQIKLGVESSKEKEIEDRKDKRVKLQGTQQSQLINQRQNDSAPVDFEGGDSSQLGTFGLQNMMPPS